MHPIADHWRFACAASQTQCREIIPKSYTFTEFKNDLDKVSIWENDDEVFVEWDGTKGTLADWKQNFDLCPNREGFHHEFANATENFRVAIVDYLKPMKKKKKRTGGHSHGGGHAPTSAFYIERLSHITFDEIITYGSPPYALDENKVKNVTRVVCGNDPVEMRCLTRWRIFRCIKRIPNPIRTKGCPNGDKLKVLDHDYAPYSNSLALFCKSIGDVEGEKCMRELFEMNSSRFKHLEGFC